MAASSTQHTWGRVSVDVTASPAGIIMGAMKEATKILSQIEHGEPVAAEQLLLLLYSELRELAAAKLAHEKPGQTLQPTALVHEAYLRLVDVDNQQRWDSRGHFFAAAAEAMRRILIENARRRQRQKHGGEFERVELNESALGGSIPDERLLTIDESLERLAAEDRQAAELVKLRFFAGFSISEAAEILGVSRSNAYAQWAYARAWLQCDLNDAV
jgi:RNA polymerase sigma factor (TIGR02999 family)